MIYVSSGSSFADRRHFAFLCSVCQRFFTVLFVRAGIINAIPTQLLPCVDCRVTTSTSSPSVQGTTNTCGAR